MAVVLITGCSSGFGLLAAVEFAMIVPIMFFMFVGAVELSQAITVDRRVTQVASSVADLVARKETSISQTEITDILRVGGYIVKPYSQSPLQVTLRNVSSSSADASKTKSSWRCTFVGAGKDPTPSCTCLNETFTLPAELRSPMIHPEPEPEVIVEQPRDVERAADPTFAVTTIMGTGARAIVSINGKAYRLGGQPVPGWKVTAIDVEEILAKLDTGSAAREELHERRIHVRLALAHFQTGVGVDRKSDASPVTVADRGGEELLRRLIHERFPTHAVVGEEMGSASGDSSHRWVLDPIDGTRAFATACPLFGTLIGLLHRGQPVLGTIHQPVPSQSEPALVCCASFPRSARSELAAVRAGRLRIILVAA